MSSGAPRRLSAPDRRRALALLGVTRWERRTRGAADAIDASPLVADENTVTPTPVPAGITPVARETALRPPTASAPLARTASVPASPLDPGTARPMLGRSRLAVQVHDDAGATPLEGPYRALLLQVLRAVDVLPMDAVFNPTGDDDLPELVLGGAPRRDDALLGPPLAVLRANPKAKRNLWPMLRRLARRLRR
jgi:hypothetical protein